MIRLFVGIPLPPELKLRLSLLSTGLPGAKWVDPGNYHVTLRFIGEVDEGLASDVHDALSRLSLPGFDLVVAGVGHFGEPKPRTLWAGVEKTAPLLQLHDAVERAVVRAGLPPETRRFAPHVTLARLQNPNPERLSAFLAEHSLFRAAPFPVSAFSLIASYLAKAGAIYEEEAGYRLR